MVFRLIRKPRKPAGCHASPLRVEAWHRARGRPRSTPHECEAWCHFPDGAGENKMQKVSTDAATRVAGDRREKNGENSCGMAVNLNGRECARFAGRFPISNFQLKRERPGATSDSCPVRSCRMSVRVLVTDYGILVTAFVLPRRRGGHRVGTGGVPRVYGECTFCVRSVYRECTKCVRNSPGAGGRWNAMCGGKRG